MSVTLNELHDAMEACGWLDCVPEGCLWMQWGKPWYLRTKAVTDFVVPESIAIDVPESVAIDAICMRVVERVGFTLHRVDARPREIAPLWFRWDGMWDSFSTLPGAVLALLRAMEKKKPTLGIKELHEAREQGNPYAIRLWNALVLITTRVWTDKEPEEALDELAKEAGR